MKSLGLMDPPRARGIDQLWAKDKVRGRAAGAQARGAGYLAAPVKVFGTSKEEGLRVAARPLQMPSPAWATTGCAGGLPTCAALPHCIPLQTQAPGREADAWKTPDVFPVFQAPLFS